ncbi:MAG TPA: hypothetical protein VGR40_11065 [Candidatus Binatus sp.]|nr:hypothetical protein [Candidatus Binatus sp.]
MIATIFTALAMMLLINARAALSQDATSAETSDDSGAVSGTSVDSNWARVDSTPAIDDGAASADKVLEIPQAKCSGDEDSGPCDANANNDPNDDDGGIVAPSPGAPPDTDTASNTTSDDWGTADEYQNQQAYNVPYPVYQYYPYSTSALGAMRRPSQVPASAFAPGSRPITQAARPPLSQGPWMTPSTMSAFSRPAGGPMMMSAPLVSMHH